MKLENVSVDLGGKRIIDNLSFDFKDSGITAVCGESGCGKSTLLNLLAGLISPDSGRAELTDVSYMFQEPRLFPWLTALENVTAVMPEKSEDRARGLLAEVGITDTGKYPSELSGGMKSRVAFARALAYPSTAILLDEPFSALDADNRARMLKLIRDDGRQCILATHDSETAAYADRVLNMK